MLAAQTATGHMADKVDPSGNDGSRSMPGLDHARPKFRLRASAVATARRQMYVLTFLDRRRSATPRRPAAIFE